MNTDTLHNGMPSPREANAFLSTRFHAPNSVPQVREFVLSVLFFPDSEMLTNQPSVYWVRNQLLRCLRGVHGLWAARICGEVLIGCKKLFGRITYWMKNNYKNTCKQSYNMDVCGENACLWGLLRITTWQRQRMLVNSQYILASFHQQQRYIWINHSYLLTK